MNDSGNSRYRSHQSGFRGAASSQKTATGHTETTRANAVKPLAVRRPPTIAPPEDALMHLQVDTEEEAGCLAQELHTATHLGGQALWKLFSDRYFHKAGRRICIEVAQSCPQCQRGSDYGLPHPKQEERMKTQLRRHRKKPTHIYRDHQQGTTSRPRPAHPHM